MIDITATVLSSNYPNRLYIITKNCISWRPSVPGRICKKAKPTKNKFGNVFLIGLVTDYMRQSMYVVSKVLK